jgi:hypothetical protein
MEKLERSRRCPFPGIENLRGCLKIPPLGGVRGCQDFANQKNTSLGPPPQGGNRSRFGSQAEEFSDSLLLESVRGKPLLILCFKFRRGLNGIDGEIRADGFAIMAVHTGFRLPDHRGMIPFDIVFCRNFKHISRAVCDAVTASFASFFNDVNNATGNLNFIGIQRNAPVFHA